MTEFARGRRVARRGLPSDRLAVLVQVVSDPRFPRLDANAQAALLVALVLWADRRGRWWPKVTTWADVLGVSVSTLGRAIRRLEVADWIARQPYLRPDGKQGSTTYQLTLVPAEQGGSQLTDHVGSLPELAAIPGQVCTTEQGGSPVTDLNGISEQELSLREEGGLVGDLEFELTRILVTTLYENGLLADSMEATS